MSETAETPKKKPTANSPRPETEDIIPPQHTVSPRKRKAEKVGDREPSVHEATPLAMHAHPTARGARRSDLVPIPSYMMERQRQRNPQTLPDPHRRMSMDMHRPRRSNTSHAGGPPPVRTRRSTMPSGPPRTMLQHAWHTVLNSDPLVDSDEECPDEHIRLDYNRRMQVITRLRGRPPTPQPERTQTTDTAS